MLVFTIFLGQEGEILQKETLLLNYVFCFANYVIFLQKSVNMQLSKQLSRNLKWHFAKTQLFIFVISRNCICLGPGLTISVIKSFLKGVDFCIVLSSLSILVLVEYRQCRFYYSLNISSVDLNQVKVTYLFVTLQCIWILVARRVTALL